MGEYLVGLDIGSSKVCAAVGKLDVYGQVQIIGITSVKCNGLRKSIVVDIDNTASSIRECIDQLNRMIDIDIKDVYISLPSEISELIYNKGVIAISSDDREITKNDVNRALEAAKLINISSDKEIVGVVPMQYIVDGYESIKDPIGMSALKLEVEAQVIVTKTTIINNLLKSLNKANLNVLGMVLQPLAMCGIVLSKDQLEMGSVLLDIGSETSDVSIFKNNNLIESTVVPLGGNNITNDISLCLKMPYSEAERIKLKYSDLDTEDFENGMEKLNVHFQDGSIQELDFIMLNKIIKARVEEILCFVKKRLIETDKYDEINEIVLVGGGISLIKGVEKSSRVVLGKPTKIGIPDFIGANNPTYATVVGIINDVAYSLKDKSSFYREEIEESKKSKKNKKDENNNKGFLSKIHEFLTDFF
ncbi:cell division protein FtsA [Haloimpatiens sp. FM7315]|uniref:cell division protein FtsA n=1 Tax=Haloimpatiens sp. FM7315 TaxID=3298609 RepID=UPI00370A5EE9